MGDKKVESVHTAEYDALIQLVRQARLKAKISQRKLSAMLGKSRGHIGFIERGVRRMDIVEFVLVAEALGLDPEQLFGEYMRSIRVVKR